MQQLIPVTARTVKQVLKSLYGHYTGNPITEGTPLRAVAEGMLRADRETRIAFLGQGRQFVNHVILIAQDNTRVVDVNTYLRVRWDPPHYYATLLYGRVMEMRVLETMTLEDFIEQSDLRHTFARRIDHNQVRDAITENLQAVNEDAPSVDGRTTVEQAAPMRRWMTWGEAVEHLIEAKVIESRFSVGSSDGKEISIPAGTVDPERNGLYDRRKLNQLIGHAQMDEQDRRRGETAAVRPTLRGVQNRVRAITGQDIELVNGGGYFYWIWDPDGDQYETESVMVNSIGQLSMDQWIEEGKDFVERMLKRHGDVA